MNEWISVNNRLPDKDDHNEYLLTDGNSYFVGYYRHDLKIWSDYNTGWIMKRSQDEWAGIKITHWRVLPKIPKE